MAILQDQLTEVPPTDSDRCSECGANTYAKGLCREHFAVKYPPLKGKKGGKRIIAMPGGGTLPAKAEAPSAPSRKIERVEVESMVVVTAQFLSITLDESFSPGEIKNGSAPIIYPHVQSSIDQMMPWMEIYGGEFLKALPWFGLIGGVVTLAIPAFDPMMEMIAGVRKPRIFRKPKVDESGKMLDPDVYTEKYKSAMNARNAADPVGSAAPKVAAVK